MILKGLNCSFLLFQIFGGGGECYLLLFENAWIGAKNQRIEIPCLHYGVVKRFLWMKLNILARAVSLALVFGEGGFNGAHTRRVAGPALSRLARLRLSTHQLVNELMTG
jgi:hypothetical protein